MESELARYICADLVQLCLDYAADVYPHIKALLCESHLYIPYFLRNKSDLVDLYVDRLVNIIRQGDFYIKRYIVVGECYAGDLPDKYVRGNDYLEAVILKLRNIPSDYSNLDLTEFDYELFHQALELDNINVTPLPPV